MLKVSKSSDGKTVSVRGAPAEMILFYCMWQSYIWPKWPFHETLESKSDAAGNQHRRVLKDIDKGHDILLSNSEWIFKVALEFAIERSRMLDIEVSID